jgi:molecular chaperone GrpE
MEEELTIMSEDKAKTENMAEDIAAAETDLKESKKKPKKTKEQKKIEELKNNISELEETINQLKDQSLRKAAEFENYKRRTEKEFLAHLEFATEGLIAELLPVIDDFERSIEHASKSENPDSLKEGVELIYKKFIGILEKKGLKVMESIGEEFDTEKHQALMQIESDMVESGHIVDQHLKGYYLNDKVIRHAQVLVAK